MTVIITFIYLASMSFTLMSIFNKKFENTIIFSFLVGVSFLYIGGLIGNIRLGFYISCLFSLLWIPLNIVKLVKKKITLKSLLRDYLTIPFFVFTFIFIFISFYEKYSSFTMWDEYSHWGPMVREMFKLNKFYSVKEATTIHPEYPPFSSLLELLWCYLANDFDQSLLYRAIAVFSASFIVPVIGYLKKDSKLILKVIYLLASLFLFSLIFFVDLSGFNQNLDTIYPDALCGLLSAYALFYILSNDKPDNYDWLYISILLCSILMTKQINMAFYALIIFYSLIKYFSLNKKKKNEIVKSILFILVIPLAIYLSWKLYLKPLNIDGQFDLSLSGVINIFKTNEISNPDSYRYVVYKNFIDSLLNTNVFNFPTISYFPSSFIIIISICLIMYMIKRRKEAALMGISLFIGTIGYVFTILVLYLTCFTEHEATTLASFDRYLSTYIYFELVLLVFIIIYSVLYYFDIKKGIISLLISIVVMTIVTNGRLSNFEIKTGYDDFEHSYKIQELLKQFEEYIDEDDKFLIVNQMYDLRLNQVVDFRYYNNDYTIVGFVDSETDKADYIFTDAEGFKEYYKDYDYVYLYFTNDVFISYFWSDQEEAMLNDRLYTIDEDGYLRLVPWMSGEEY